MISEHDLEARLRTTFAAVAAATPVSDVPAPPTGVDESRGSGRSRWRALAVAGAIGGAVTVTGIGAAAASGSLPLPDYLRSALNVGVDERTDPGGQADLSTAQKVLSLTVAHGRPADFYVTMTKDAATTARYCASWVFPPNADLASSGGGGQCGSSSASSGHFLFGGDPVSSSSPLDGDLTAFRVGTAVRVRLLVPGRPPTDLPVADGWSAAWAPYDHAPGTTEVIGYDRRGYVIGRVAVFHADAPEVDDPRPVMPSD